MSSPNLYRYEGSNAFFCAHEFAVKNKMSIRKARRVLARAVNSGKLLFLGRSKTARPPDVAESASSERNFQD